MSFEFSQTSLDRLRGVDDRLQRIMLLAIRHSPIDFGIASGLRTADEQFELFRKGREYRDGEYRVVNKSEVVTQRDGYMIPSMHQHGAAVDVYAWVNGAASWDHRHLAIIAGVVLACASMEDIKIKWGGTFGSKEFKGWDYPHFQV